MCNISYTYVAMCKANKYKALIMMVAEYQREKGKIMKKSRDFY